MGLRLWKIPDQVIRLGILLIIAVAVLIVVRIKFVPESFGEVGHYRADAVTAVASQNLRYAGSQLCVECHDSEGEAKRSSYHRTLSCEVCHGPSAEHANDYEAQTPVIPRARGEACLYCHAYLPSRPTGFPQITCLSSLQTHRLPADYRASPQSAKALYRLSRPPRPDTAGDSRNLLRMSRTDRQNQGRLSPRLSRLRDLPRGGAGAPREPKSLHSQKAYGEGVLRPVSRQGRPGAHRDSARRTQQPR
jgi:hypothetical protein